MPNSKLLFIDSDIFALLSAANLLDQFAKAVECTVEEMRRLPALRYQIMRKKFREKYSPECLERILSDCERIPEVQERPEDDDVFQMLLDIPDIDEGEALLLALLGETPSSLLATGDKRCLKALAGTSVLTSFKSSVGGRIICLEVAVVRLIIQEGVQIIGTRFKTLQLDTVNKTLAIVFGTKVEFDHQESIRQLNSYANSLIAECETLSLYSV